MRIVRIGFDTITEPDFDTLSWTCPYPEVSSSECPPSFFERNIVNLHSLHRVTFAPFSMSRVAPGIGQLVGFKVYSALGSSAGIPGVGFLYDTGVEDTIGLPDNASLAFFLYGAETLAKVAAYRDGSKICHLEVSYLSRIVDEGSNRIGSLQTFTGRAGIYLDCGTTFQYLSIAWIMWYRRMSILMDSAAPFWFVCPTLSMRLRS